MLYRPLVPVILVCGFKRTEQNYSVRKEQNLSEKVEEAGSSQQEQEVNRELDTGFDNSVEWSFL